MVNSYTVSETEIPNGTYSKLDIVVFDRFRIPMYGDATTAKRLLHQLIMNGLLFNPDVVIPEEMDLEWVGEYD